MYELEIKNNKKVEEKKKPSGNPKTGDDSNMGLWLIIIGISGGSLIGLIVSNKVRKKKEEEMED